MNFPIWTCLILLSDGWETLNQLAVDQSTDARLYKKNWLSSLRDLLYDYKISLGTFSQEANVDIFVLVD